MYCSTNQAHKTHKNTIFTHTVHLGQHPNWHFKGWSPCLDWWGKNVGMAPPFLRLTRRGGKHNLGNGGGGRGEGKGQRDSTLKEAIQTPVMSQNAITQAWIITTASETNLGPEFLVCCRYCNNCIWGPVEEFFLCYHIGQGVIGFLLLQSSSGSPWGKSGGKVPGPVP